MEHVVATLCRAVDPDEFESSVLCLRGRGPVADQLAAEGFEVLSIASDPSRPDYLAAVKVARLLRQHPVDVIHSHNTTALLFGVSGARLAGIRRAVHTDHSRVYPEQWHIRLAEWLMVHAVEQVVAVSDSTALDLVQHIGVPPDRIQTILNGIDPGPFDNPVDSRALRLELGLAPEQPVIGLAVRLASQKGLGVLLDAAALLRREFPGLQLAIAGEGDQRQLLEAQAAELGLGEVAHFLGVRHDVPDLLRMIDVYVLPSFWEGLPMGVLEAMAASRPIVATDVGGIGRAISHESSGLLVRPKDPQELADAIGRMLREPEFAESCGREARAVFEKRFSASHMARSYEVLYRGREGRVAR